MNKKELEKLRNHNGETFTVDIKNGITMHNVKVEYYTDNLALFILQNGEYKTVHPSEIIRVEAEK